MRDGHDPTQDAPEVTTERLTLRGHRLDDFRDIAAMWADPEITRHIGGKPLTEEEVWASQLRCVGHWSVMGFGYWVVRDKSSGRFVGEVGFADRKRDISPSFAGAPEIGWVLDRWAHGQGLATEAARAAISWCEMRLGPVRTVCMIAPENESSLRVAAKCGYHEFARTTYKGQPTILLERRRS